MGEPMTINGWIRMSPWTLGALAAAAMALLTTNLLLADSWMDGNMIAAWVVAQWLPRNSINEDLHAQAWAYWEDKYGARRALTQQPPQDLPLAIPEVNVQEHKDDLLHHLEATLGHDWRRRPLKLVNLWSADELANPARRLSVPGLLQENLTIPYFTDARRPNALSPDAQAPISAIVANITTRGSPHKIGSQFLLQHDPELIREIAPTQLLTSLFGDYFQPHHVKGFGPGGILPPFTTVPLFVASGSSIQQQQQSQQQQPQQTGSSEEGRSGKPFTALHCEPIGNVAVQLSGVKQWTLVDPLFSFLLRPSTAPDGRAFFASYKDLHDQRTTTTTTMVPYYQGVTSAGDAMWVPTWTWHRVDYMDSDLSNTDIAIGGSLFHFRPVDYFANNPLFAVLMIPAILQEILGLKTQ